MLDTKLVGMITQALVKVLSVTNDFIIIVA